MFRQWRKHPPVHELVASYMDYKAPAEEPELQAPAQQIPEPRGSDHNAPPTWLGAGVAVPASEGLRTAKTSAQALDALEQMFFGKVFDVHQL